MPIAVSLALISLSCLASHELVTPWISFALSLPETSHEASGPLPQVHVHFPSGLMLSKEQENVLRTILGKATVQVPSSPHDDARSIAHISYKSGIPSKEDDFWFRDGSTEGDEQPLICAQQ